MGNRITYCIEVDDPRGSGGYILQCSPRYKPKPKPEPPHVKECEPGSRYKCHDPYYQPSPKPPEMVPCEEGSIYLCAAKNSRSLRTRTALTQSKGQQMLSRRAEPEVQADEFQVQDLMDGFENDITSTYTPTYISDVYDPGFNPGMPEIGEPREMFVPTFAIIVSCALAALFFLGLGLSLRVRSRRRAEARNLAMLRANDAGRIHAILEAQALIRVEEQKRGSSMC